VTVGSTGSVGKVHVRDEPQWFLHDDALAIEIHNSKLDLNYFRYALQSAIDEARFDYSAKLYKERLEGIKIKLPYKAGAIDVEAQVQIAVALREKEEAEKLIKGLSVNLSSVEINIPSMME